MSEKMKNMLLATIRNGKNPTRVRQEAITKLSTNIAVAYKNADFVDTHDMAETFINIGQDVYQEDGVRIYSLRFGLEGVFQTISSSIRGLKSVPTTSFNACAMDQVKTLKSYLPNLDETFSRLLSIAEDVSEKPSVSRQAIGTYDICAIYLGHISDYKIPDALNERMAGIAAHTENDPSVREYALRFGVR